MLLVFLPPKSFSFPTRQSPPSSPSGLALPPPLPALVCFFRPHASSPSTLRNRRPLLARRISFSPVVLLPRPQSSQRFSSSSLLSSSPAAPFNISQVPPSPAVRPTSCYYS
eukprot:GHVT01043507.1.p1 GENE.GHVT01043507.1~~GHVT01043507.1.p1  ORF type:complete len:111 (-),score=22.48 GHVT01043507.1:2370-2702(-)